MIKIKYNLIALKKETKMNNFSICPYCESYHNDRTYSASGRNICSKCQPLSNEEVKKRSQDYLPVSKGYISYDDTLPVYWGY